MSKKKTTKSKTDEIPKMTTASYVKENNHLLWEIRQHTAEFSRDNRIATKEIWEMLADVYCYADDLRQYTYKFIKYPEDTKNKDRLINHIGEFNKFNNRMTALDQMVAGDKGDYVQPTEREKAN